MRVGKAKSRALHLSEEEALALLDLCLMSDAEDDPVKERVLSRVAEIARDYISEARAEAEGAKAEAELSSASPVSLRGKEDRVLFLHRGVTSLPC